MNIYIWVADLGETEREVTLEASRRLYSLSACDSIGDLATSGRFQGVSGFWLQFEDFSWLPVILQGI